MKWEHEVLSAHRRRRAVERARIKESGRRAADAALEALLRERRAAEVLLEPSYGTIPRLWVGSGLMQALKSAAEARCEREAALATWEDLERIRLGLRDAQSAPFDGSRRINYEEVCRARREAGAAGGELSAPRFLSLRRDCHGRVSARDLYNTIDRAACVAKTRQALRPYCRGTSHIREHELEKYIYDLLPDMPAAQSMDENFHAFYVFTASRRFMFFLDCKRRGRICLETLAASPLSLELHEMAELPAGVGATPSPPALVTKASSRPTTFPPTAQLPAPLPPPLAASWFYPDNAQRVYSDYLELDVDHNGMLSKHEFLHFRGPRGETRLTDAFVDRVFEEIITYRTENPADSGKFDSEMDFKTYLDVVLAFENIDTPQAHTFFWRLLDTGKHGRLDAFGIHYFFRDVAARLEAEGFDTPSTADVVDEIFDMVKPAHPRYLTLDDLQRSKVAHTVILMLVDVAGFLAYDNREHLMQDADDDDF